MILRTLIIVASATLCFATILEAVTLEGQCAIHFYAESTLHDFEGEAACQPFSLQSEMNAAGREIIRHPAVTVLVSQMDTGNKGRDEKMRSMFDSNIFPEIEGLFADLDPEIVLQQLRGSDQGAGALEFDLQIRDVAQRVRASTSEVTITPAKIGFVMEFPLSLSSYGLEPPSVLGMIKVADTVRVVTRVTLLRRSPNNN